MERIGQKSIQTVSKNKSKHPMTAKLLKKQTSVFGSTERINHLATVKVKCAKVVPKHISLDPKLFLLVFYPETNSVITKRTNAN